jgi:membrane protease YdiL (CAAX protease family)
VVLVCLQLNQGVRPQEGHMMSIIRTFMKQHPVPSYYALVFAISWGGSLIVLGPEGLVGNKPISSAQLPLVYLAALAGPSVAGILSVGLISGRAGLRALRSRLLRLRVSVIWYAIALLTAPLLTTGILFALSLTSPIFLPTIMTTSAKTGLLMTGIAVGLVVPFFEEIGWTGFAVPQLRERYGIATTGLIVGLLWGAWHFPLFSGSASSSPAIPQPLYLAVLLFSWLPPYRVLMVWVYDHTESLLMGMLMHVPIVVSSFVLIPTARSEVVVTFDLVFAALLWAVVAALTVANGGTLSRQQAYRS